MSLDLPVLATPRLILRPGLQTDVPAILHYYRENEAHLTPFEPRWHDNFLTEAFWRERIERSLVEFNYSQALRFFMFKRSTTDRVIGTVNFTQFTFGAAESCLLGYGLAQTEQGHGYMLESLQTAIQYIFKDLNLHRIMATYMPRNQRSSNVLKRLGFVVEGYARDYLLIDGKWEDHILTSLINPDWQQKKDFFRRFS